MFYIWPVKVANDNKQVRLKRVTSVTIFQLKRGSQRDLIRRANFNIVIASFRTALSKLFFCFA